MHVSAASHYGSASNRGSSRYGLLEYASIVIKVAAVLLILSGLLPHHASSQITHLQVHSQPPDLLTQKGRLGAPNEPGGRAQTLPAL